MGHCSRDVGLDGEMLRSEGLIASVHLPERPYRTKVGCFGVGEGHAVECAGAEISKPESILCEFLRAPKPFLAGMTQAQCDFGVEVWH